MSFKSELIFDVFSKLLKSMFNRIIVILNEVLFVYANIHWLYLLHSKFKRVSIATSKNYKKNSTRTLKIYTLSTRLQKGEECRPSCHNDKMISDDSCEWNRDKNTSTKWQRETDNNKSSIRKMRMSITFVIFGIIVNFWPDFFIERN